MRLATLLFLATVCSAAPQFVPSDLQYMQIGDETYLSRAARQAEEDGGNSFRELLLEIRQVAASTLVNYGCFFDASSDSDRTQFTQKFLEAYAMIVPNVDPEEKIMVTARKITAKIINDYGCAGGKVSYLDPVFEDKFKAAFAKEILEAGDGNEVTRNVAALIMSSKYNCGKIDPNSKDFIVKFLSTFVDTVDLAKKGSYDSEGTDLTRWHIAQLIRKYGCGNPDPNSEEFKTNFFIGYASIALL